MLVLLCAGPDAGEAAIASRDRGRARPHGDSGPRRCARHRAPAAGPADRVAARSGRDAATAVGDLLFSRAFAELAGSGDRRGASPCSPAPRSGSRAASSPSATTPSTPGHRGALPGALPAEDGAPVRVRLPDRRRPRSRRRARAAEFGAEIGLAFQLLDDVLDVAGPPERTGKARGTDLLDGTVNLPLILAARTRPGARRARPPHPRRGRRGRGVRPDRRDRRPRAGASRGARAGRARRRTRSRRARSTAPSGRC